MKRINFRQPFALSFQDWGHIMAAEGWLELGSHAEAHAELDNIGPHGQGHPETLYLRWETYAKAGKWTDCVSLGYALARRFPNEPEPWINLAIALHKQKRTAVARKKLLSVVEKFRYEWIIPYNLACYSCQLGMKKEAGEWLQKSYNIGDPKRVKLLSLSDPELDPLWRGDWDGKYPEPIPKYGC